jgi:hypothetical protein
VRDRPQQHDSRLDCCGCSQDAGAHQGWMGEGVGDQQDLYRADPSCTHSNKWPCPPPSPPPHTHHSFPGQTHNIYLPS